jgi:spore coat protein U-like protein
MKRTAINLFAATVLVFGATAAFGQSASSSNTDNVTADVAESCTVDVFGLAFGTYDPASGNATASTTIEVSCTKDLAPTIDLSAGRTITNGSDSLTYSLWTDALHTAAWVDGVTVGTSTDIAVPMEIDVYGLIAAGQNVSAGSYAGTLNATVNY